MKRANTWVRWSTGLAGVMLGIGWILASTAPASADGVAPTPAGFTKYLVYMAEATLKPEEPSSFTDPDSVDFFQRQIMGRDDEEIVIDQGRAKQFFLDRFGLDFTKTEPDDKGVERIPGATFNGFFLNPNVNYRAYTISEEAVPAEGWTVRDGGWNVTLTDDMVLHGEYGGKEGKLVPAGASVVFGNYNILAERPNGQDQIVIHYESDTPIFANADGVTPFVCNLIHPQWEQGKARGVVFPENIIRNVLTFPPQLP